MKSFLTALMISLSLFSSNTDLIIFSYNRPLQLYSLLESVDKRVKGLNKTVVIYRSDQAFVQGYEIVKADFPNVEFDCQISHRKKSHVVFKPMVMNVLKDEERLGSKFLLFAVDDIIITDDINLDVAENLLETHPEIYAFYYRLGKNVVQQDWTAPGHSGVPPLHKVGEDLYTWKFKEGKIDWNYPNTVDFTLYRKGQIRPVLERLSFTNPNHFEGAWSTVRIKDGIGAIHGHSKMVNMPMNRVTKTHSNNIIGNYLVEELNQIFLDGKKIDIYSLDNDVVHSPHQDVPFKFVGR